MRLASLMEDTHKSFAIKDNGCRGTGYELNYMKYNIRTGGKNHR